MDEGSDSGTQPQDGQNLYQPEQVITPSAVPASAPLPSAQPLPESPVAIHPASSSGQPTQPEPLPQPLVQQVNQDTSVPVPGLLYADDESQPGENQQDAITWTASEYIANQKSPSWYLMLGVAAVIVAALIWLLTRDLFPTVIVLIGVVLLGVYAGRKPRQESYTLDEHGITIGARHYDYREFRSFAVGEEGAFLRVELTPLKRFAIDTAIYLDPNDEERIIDYLSQFLPMEEAKSTFADGLMRRIKF